MRIKNLIPFFIVVFISCNNNEIKYRNINNYLNPKIYIPKGMVLDENNSRYIEIASFYINKYEISIEEYKNCVKAKTCAKHALPNKSELYLSKPMPGIYYDDAVQYCKFMGGRLPTFYEWKRAAVGDKNWKYPWGNDYHDGYANYNHNVYPSILLDTLCSKENCPKEDTSIFGVRNMAGNVGERLQKENGKYLFMPGGILCDSPICMSINNRWAFPFPQPIFAVGFRCVYDKPTELFSE